MRASWIVGEQPDSLWRELGEGNVWQILRRGVSVWCSAPEFRVYWKLRYPSGRYATYRLQSCVATSVQAVYVALNQGAATSLTLFGYDLDGTGGWGYDEAHAPGRWGFECCCLEGALDEARRRGVPVDRRGPGPGRTSDTKKVRSRAASGRAELLEEGGESCSAVC